MRQRLKQALIDWERQQHWTVFGTLKFVSSMNVNTFTGDKLIKLYWNKLDRLYYGRNRMQENYGVDRFVFKHFGANGDNLHYHYVARPAFSNFRFFAHKVWDELAACCTDPKIDLIRTVEGSTVYLAHEMKMLSIDTVHLEATKHQNIGHSAADIRSMYQIRRLLKNMQWEKFDEIAA